MRLFRKIRRKMLDKGKIKNYLVYALGEILLIVIGILIAWKINNLNELRKNRIVEVKIYESLNEELESNLILIDSSIANYSNNVIAIKNILNYIGKETLELTDELKSDIININYRTTKLHNGLINSVNSTSKIEFIENDMLEELIATYPSELDNFENQELKINDIINNRLKPVIEKHISLVDILSNRYSKYNKIQTLAKESNYNELLNSRDYQNTLIDRLIQTENQLTIANSLKSKTQNIVVKLNKELET